MRRLWCLVGSVVVLTACTTDPEPSATPAADPPPLSEVTDTVELGAVGDDGAEPVAVGYGSLGEPVVLLEGEDGALSVARGAEPGAWDPRPLTDLPLLSDPPRLDVTTFGSDLPTSLGVVVRNGDGLILVTDYGDGTDPVRTGWPGALDTAATSDRGRAVTGPGARTSHVVRAEVDATGTPTGRLELTMLRSGQFQAQTVVEVGAGRTVTDLAVRHTDDQIALGLGTADGATTGVLTVRFDAIGYRGVEQTDLARPVSGGFVAFAARTPVLAATDPDTGSVTLVDQDGAVAATAAGLTDPAGVAIDPTGRWAWLTGSDDDGRPVLVTVDLDAGRAAATTPLCPGDGVVGPPVPDPAEFDDQPDGLLVRGQCDGAHVLWRLG